MEAGGGCGAGLAFADTLLSTDESEGFISFTQPGKIASNKMVVRMNGFLITKCLIDGDSFGCYFRQHVSVI
jgi:hypothetical protein